MDSNKSAQKPKDIIYGLTERPPFIFLILLACQQALMLIPYLILVTVLAKIAYLPLQQSLNMISLTLLGMGVGTFLQVLRKGPIGSGYMIAVCPMPNYFQPSIVAIEQGGIGLMSGMVVFSSICQIFVAFIIKKLRAFFPTTLAGVIFCLIGLDVGVVGLQAVFTLSENIYSTEFIKSFSCFFITFACIIAFNVWGRGLVKLLCCGLGLFIGAMAAIYLGEYSAVRVMQFQQTVWFAIPTFHFVDYHFDPKLILIFLISSVASVLRASGALTTIQQVNDANWSRPNQVKIRKGLLADGLAALTGGLLNTTGLGCTPSSVGLSKACGVTSRWVAYAFILGCFILALCPKLGAVLLLLPKSVVAGGLLFLSCVLFIGGLKIVAAQEIESRRTFILCIAILTGLSTKLFPHFYLQFPHVLQPIVTSILSLGALTAFVLNLIFRLGIKKTEYLVVDDNNAAFVKELKEKINTLGVNEKVAQGILASFKHIIQAVIAERHNSSPIKGKIVYDEIDFKIILEYDGSLIALPSARKNYEYDDFGEENAFIEGLNSLYKEFSPSKIECSVVEEKVKIKLTFAV